MAPPAALVVVSKQMGNIIFWALSFGVVTLGALLSVMVLAALGTTRARLRYRKLGYRVRWFRGNHFVYEEPLPGEIGVTNWWTDFLIGMSVPRALSVSGIRRVAFEMLPAKYMVL